MCVFLCMGGNSTTWMNTAVLVTSIRNFRSNRGPVSGILKGFVGLSTAIFTTLCSALFADDPGSFLIMLSVIPFAVCLTGVFFLRETPPDVSAGDDDGEEVKYFGFFNVVAVAVALFLLAYGFIRSPSMLVSRLFVAVLVVMLASPLGIPVYSYLKGRLGGGNDVERQRLKEPLLQIPEKENEGVVAEEEAEIVKRAPEVGEEHTIVEALRSVDFWILFVSFLCGVGTGLAVMNNMCQIGLALGYPDISLFLSLTSIFGFFGRTISGTVSEFTIK